MTGERATLLVHGGAWWIPDEEVTAAAIGVARALARGRQVLEGGGSALDAVVEAVVLLEDDPAFDAGLGSVLTSDGRIEMDAAVMDGSNLRAGAVAAVERVRNPVRLARALLEDGRHVMLAGPGALLAAERFGLPLAGPDELILERERKRHESIRALREFELRDPFDHPRGTVGAAARDSAGRLAAATSTGGVPHKWPGRVGDAPILGAGTYADDERGACSATGWGESILRATVALDAVSRLAFPSSVIDGALDPAMLSPAGAPGMAGSVTADIARSRPIVVGPDPETGVAHAARASIARLALRVGGLGGVLLLDRHGNPAFAFNTPRMSRGVWREGDGEGFVQVDP